MTIGANRGKLPLIVFGAVEDMTTWTAVNTPTVTGGASDPFGGTGGYTIDDNSGSLIESVRRTLSGLPTGVSSAFISGVVLKEGTAAQTAVRILDTTATTSRGTITITWSTPSAVATGGASLIGFIALESGHYLILFTAASIVVGNTNTLEIAPAGLTGSATGTVIAYGRRVILPGAALDSATTFGDPREGSEWVQGASGLEDAWIEGTDEVLMGSFRHILAEADSLPRPCTGWNGGGENFCTNVGVDYWLNAWARDKQTQIWVPDRTMSLANKTTYLVEPMKGPPGVESDFTRRIDLKFRTSDQTAFVGY